MNILNTIVKTNDLIFDVGSNIGNKSAKFLNLGAKVIAFEPQHDCFTYSLNRFKNNKNWKIENLALDKKKGKEIIYISNFNTLSSMSSEFINKTKKQRFINYNWDSGVEVDTDTLDNVIEKHGLPSFIKIDSEGYEFNILQGLTKSVNFISIEFTPELYENTVKCIDYINNLNKENTLYNYGSKESKNFKFNNWQTKEMIIKFLKTLKHQTVEFGDVYSKRNV